MFLYVHVHGHYNIEVILHTVSSIVIVAKTFICLIFDWSILP